MPTPEFYAELEKTRSWSNVAGGLADVLAGAGQAYTGITAQVRERDAATAKLGRSSAQARIGQGDHAGGYAAGAAADAAEARLLGIPATTPRPAETRVGSEVTAAQDLAAPYRPQAGSARVGLSRTGPAILPQPSMADALTSGGPAPAPGGAARIGLSRIGSTSEGQMPGLGALPPRPQAPDLSTDTGAMAPRTAPETRDVMGVDWSTDENKAMARRVAQYVPPKPDGENVPEGATHGHYDASGKWVVDYVAPRVVNPNTVIRTKSAERNTDKITGTSRANTVIRTTAATATAAAGRESRERTAAADRATRERIAALGREARTATTERKAQITAEQIRLRASLRPAAATKESPEAKQATRDLAAAEKAATEDAILTVLGKEFNPTRPRGSATAPPDAAAMRKWETDRKARYEQLKQETRERAIKARRSLWDINDKNAGSDPAPPTGRPDPFTRPGGGGAPGTFPVRSGGGAGAAPSYQVAQGPEFDPGRDVEIPRRWDANLPPRVRKKANAAMSQMTQALPGLAVYSGQRSADEQRAIIGGRPRPTVGNPGTSFHQRGTAFDLRYNGKGIDRSSPAYEWMVKNAATYGFRQRREMSTPGGLDEPWHWEFSPTLYRRSAGARQRLGKQQAAEVKVMEVAAQFGLLDEGSA